MSATNLANLFPSDATDSLFWGSSWSIPWIQSLKVCVETLSRINQLAKVISIGRVGFEKANWLTCQSVLNAFSPTHISYNIQPNDQMSSFLLNVEFDTDKSSGARYDCFPFPSYVVLSPHDVPVEVRPKSAIFHHPLFAEYKTGCKFYRRNSCITIVGIQITVNFIMFMNENEAA